ncbi:MAG: hypothetical protein C0616_08710 [Desulfuromonas sp.]|nr:MAG: hypothetical protein C0616_08710 [Desulfuromonas sp.]
MIRLTFHGTRASTATTSPQHQWHSLLQIEADETSLLIDCGSDWRDRLPTATPDAIILTHGHNDHAGGVTNDIPCPVFASEMTAGLLTSRPKNVRIFPAEAELSFGPLRVIPFPAPHSLRAPMHGLRISSGDSTLIYLPDVATLQNVRSLLGGAALYIGDGSSFDHDYLRTEEGASCGHASITDQLSWCAQAGVRKCLLTHCGEEVCRNPEAAGLRLAGTGSMLGLKAEFATDGMVLEL